MNEIKEENIRAEEPKNEGYNPNNTEVVEGLKAGIMVDGIITTITDGIVKDFVDKEHLDKWKRPEQRCIKIIAECIYQEKTYNDEILFTYNLTDGKTTFSSRSNLGKFNSYYKSTPKSSNKIQMKTNAKGFFKLVIE